MRRRLERSFWSANARVWDDVLADEAARRRIAVLGAWLAAAMPVGATVADLGCGTGNHVLDLQSRGLAVIGVDGTPAMLARARDKVGGASFVQADLARPLPFATGSLAGVISVYAAQFVDLPALAGEVRRVLAPGGALVIEVPRPEPVTGSVGAMSRRYRAFRQVKRLAATAGERAGWVRATSLDLLVHELEAAGFDVPDRRPTERSAAVLARTPT